MADDKKTVNILIGCGGSGLKTLAKVNHLLCQDFYWRSSLDEQIYYVVVDTDYRELNDFAETIQRDLNNVSRHPWTLPIGLSEGLQSLQRIVEPAFVNRYKPKPPATQPTAEQKAAQQRLLKHWWYEGEDKVFVAPKVVPLTRGAGQCPPVSYFLTWRKLDELARSFQKMITEIINRVGGKDNVAVWNVVVVAGLSGGTGRGSWELIAFKMREMLGREGIAANPRAFLFDSSCLEDVMEKHPEQRIPMQANALTGLSQLSCWVQNQQHSQRREDAAIEYKLPHMDYPERKDSDVLQMRFDEDRNHGAPVNHSYLIFRDNGTTRLPESNDYYEMAGAAIYTALSKSQIDRADINSAFPFVGLAVGTVEVDAASLRNYFELLAGQRLIQDMLKPHPGLLAEQLTEFRKRCPHQLRVTAETLPQRLASIGQKDQDPGLLDLILKALLADAEKGLRALKQRLEGDDPEEVLATARLLLQPDAVSTDACVEAILKKHKLQPHELHQELQQTVLELFRKSRSVEPGLQFLKQVISDLQADRAGLPESVDSRQVLSLRPTADAPETSSKSLELITSRGGRYLPLQRHFSQEDSKAILDSVIREIPSARYRDLRKKLIAVLDQYLAIAERLDQHLRVVARCVRSVEKRFERRAAHSVSGRADAHKALFTDPEHPELSVEGRYGGRSFFRRIMKPAMREGEPVSLLEGRLVMRHEFLTKCEAYLVPTRNDDDEFGLTRQIEASLEDAAQENVTLQDGFLLEHFSLHKVLCRLRDAWLKRLQQPVSADRRNELEEQFFQHFGVRLRRDRHADPAVVSYEHIADGEFVLRVVGGMARTCRPYWRLKGHSGESRVVIFTASDVPRADALEILRDVLPETVTADLIRESTNPDIAARQPTNPFIGIVYSREGTPSMDNLLSAEYFNDDARLRGLLEDAEAEDGRTIFAVNDAIINGGIGYTDPMYVRNPQLAAKRWRPWLPLPQSADSPPAQDSAPQTPDNTQVSPPPRTG